MSGTILLLLLLRLHRPRSLKLVKTFGISSEPARTLTRARSTLLFVHFVSNRYRPRTRIRILPSSSVRSSRFEYERKTIIRFASFTFFSNVEFEENLGIRN